MTLTRPKLSTAIAPAATQKSAESGGHRVAPRRNRPELPDFQNEILDLMAPLFIFLSRIRRASPFDREAFDTTEANLLYSSGSHF